MHFKIRVTADPSEITPEAMKSLEPYLNNDTVCEGLFLVTFNGEYKGYAKPDNILVGGTSAESIAATIECTPDLLPVGDAIFSMRLKKTMKEMLTSNPKADLRN